MEAEVGLETTLRRPIINTRDEPHADRDRWRRLHLIIGDANMFESVTLLKTGTTSAVLFILENIDADVSLWGDLDALRLADPVAAVREVSRDLTLTRRLEMANGSRMTALEIQHEYLRIARAAMEARASSDDATAEIFDRWHDVLTRLGRSTQDDVADVEWATKLRLLEGMRRRDHLSWDSPRLAAFDLQWTDIRPERGVVQKLLKAGAVERVSKEEQVLSAVHHAPVDTRAYFRGESIARFGEHVSAASWDSVIFDVPGAANLQRVPMLDPLRGTKEHVGALFAEHEDAAGFLAALLG